MTYHRPMKFVAATLLLAAIPLTSAAFTSTANATDNLRFLQTQEAYAIAYSNRGFAYYNKGQYDRAIANYDKAIKLDPKFAIAYNNRGIAYGQKGDDDRAFADFDTAIKLDPKSADTYYNRGIVYGQKGDYDRAIADFDTAIKLDPKTEVVSNKTASKKSAKKT